jgi:hypothetical protein
MTRRWAFLIALLVVLAGTAYGASRILSQTRARILQGEPGLAMLQAYLGLTPDQRSRIAGIDEEFARTRPILRQRVWEARDRFLAAVRDPKSDDEDIVSALRQFVRAREEMAVNTISYIVAVRKHLTLGQREKLIRVMECGVCGPGLGPGPGCGRRGGGACGLGMLGPATRRGRGTGP